MAPFGWFRSKARRVADTHRRRYLLRARWSPDGALDLLHSTHSWGLSRVSSRVADSPEVVTHVDICGWGLRSTVDSRSLCRGGRGLCGLHRLPGQTVRNQQNTRPWTWKPAQSRTSRRAQTPRYIPSTGHLLFMDANEGTLLAAPFDAKKLELTGAAVPVVEGSAATRPGMAVLRHIRIGQACLPDRYRWRGAFVTARYGWSVTEPSERSILDGSFGDNR